MVKKRISNGIPAMIGIAVVIVLMNVILDSMLVGQSKLAIKSLIDNRMLDIANTAANMLDGEVLRRMDKEDVGSKEYKDIDRTLRLFMDNIDLRYIYTVRPEHDGTFSFLVDPDLDNPGEFGAPVVATDAIKLAAEGECAVDEEPYEDEWGRFYSAYSPVFSRNTGAVVAIVAVDFDAEWYDSQMRKYDATIMMNTILSLLIGACLIIIVGSQIRKRIDEIKSKQADSMITALASDYWSVYYVNLDEDAGICYRVHAKLIGGLREGEEFSFLERFTNYANSYVTEEYREGFLRFIQPSAIRGGLEKRELISYRYLVRRNGKESYEMLRIAGVRRAEDRRDGIIHSVGVGFTDVDQEMKNSMKQAEALKVALASAREANRSKTAFLANMSHEMRTPMNAIIGCDRIALTDPGLSSNVREDLEQIGNSANQLLGLINNILDMSRIENGTIKINSEPFELAEILNALEITFSARCRAKELAWRSSLPPDAAGYYIGDGEKLEQAITNILDNAVKFTPRGGLVQFIVQKQAVYDGRTTLSFTVKDTGVGMSGDFLPKVFDIFSQENASLANQNGSTGLGLALTKNIIEMMNGTITVNSDKDEGTTVIMTVTLTDASENASSGSVAAKRPEDDLTLAGRRILVVEDIMINAKIVAKILTQEQVIVEHAYNGKDAVDMFAGHQEDYYDAVLMDLRMPIMDGLEATRRIREMDRADAKRIPIIALTANAFDEDVQNSLQAGMNAHLSKPADPAEICSTLRRLMKEAKG